VENYPVFTPRLYFWWIRAPDITRVFAPPLDAEGISRRFKRAGGNLKDPKSDVRWRHPVFVGLIWR